MANVYDIGDLVRISAAFTNADGDAADPLTVTLKWQNGAGTEVAYTYAASEITKDSTGNYHKDLSPLDTGRHCVLVIGTGTVQAATESSFVVRHSEF